MNQASFWKAHFALLLCLTVGIWGLLFYLVPRGFEMTDNAFYLMAVRNYDDFRAFPGMFNVFTKSLYNMGGESVINLRLLGAFVYLVVSILSSIIAIKYFVKEQFAQTTIHRWYVYGIGLIVLTASTLQYNNWVNTPNYNWLNHLGLMIFLSGLFIWLNKVKPEHSTYAPFLIMFGFGLSFWAKASTAILMPIMILIILLINRHTIMSLLSLKHFVTGMIGIFISLLFVFLQGDSVTEIIQKIQSGITLQATKNTGFQDLASYLQTELIEMLGLLYPIITYSIQNIAFILIPILGAIGFSFYYASREKPQQYIALSARFFTFLGWLINVLIISYQLDVFQMAVWSLRIFFITLIFAALSIFIEGLMNINDDSNQHQSVKTSLGWSLIVFFIPTLFSFGTDSSFTLHTGWASHFYLLATTILWINPLTTKNKFIKYFAPIVLISLISYVMIVSANEPYRQTDTLYDMSVEVPIQFGEDRLIVGQSMASYIIELQGQTTLAGFVPQTPIIDFTRNSPGTVFILDGRTDVFPWILGSNEPPHDFIVSLLEQWTAEDIEAAWLITTTDSTLESESEILAHFDLDLHTDYEELFTITRPYREGSQTFWRPINIP